MDYKYIEQLVERYLEAHTTLQEEEILRILFSQEELPAGMELHPAADTAVQGCRHRGYLTHTWQCCSGTVGSWL